MYPWSFDGRHLLYSVLGPKGSGDLWVLSVDGEPKPDSIPGNGFRRNAEANSRPDGRWVAYESNESGRYEIYVRGFPRSGRQVAGVGGRRAHNRAGGATDGRSTMWRRVTS